MAYEYIMESLILAQLKGKGFNVEKYLQSKQLEKDLET
jgi:hypothetical protein